jgi:hypothetical protein
LTSKRPYRCHACNWRGWAPEGLLVTADGDVADAPPAPPDLHAIDSALGKAPREPAAPEPGRRKRSPAARPSRKRHAK